MSRARRAVRRNSGAVLLETVVALAILGVAMGVLMQVHTEGLWTGRVAYEHTQGIIVAEGVLARIGTALAHEPAVVEGDGGPESRYRWTARFAPVKRHGDEVPGLIAVSVEVRWRDARGTLKRTTLHTERALRGQ